MANNTDDRSSTTSKLPGTFKQFCEKFPDLAAAHDAMTAAALAAGPLDAKTCSLIKIGVSLGAGLESAVKSHVRRASEAGATPTEIEQAILLAMTTVGFPRTVAAWSWARQQFERDRIERGSADR
ncbi:MAG: carboxymuconolactone decarboxylase family protein [Planctomycetaceae bacterium]|nr:carboxymuconolactone decarboxylase family protein [Planctomycetaceae bacterium]